MASPRFIPSGSRPWEKAAAVPSEPDSVEAEPDGPSERQRALRPTDEAEEAQRRVLQAQETAARLRQERDAAVEREQAIVRRAQRDEERARDRAAEALLEGLLPAMDALELAVRTAHADGSSPALIEGLELVMAELLRGLTGMGVSRLEPMGDMFDPAYMEAVATQPSDGENTGRVVEVLRAGYRTEGVVLRAAQVVVAA